MSYNKDYYNKAIRKPLIKKICKFCGNSFKTRKTNQKYCSSNCVKIYKEKYQEKYLEEYHKKYDKDKIQLSERICKLCGSKFQPKQPRQRFCKPECNLIYQRTIHFSGRWQIFNRDNFTCQYCGKNPTEDGIKLHLDHIKPKADGGTDDFENLVTACSQCNTEKGTKSLRNEVAFKKRFSKKLL